MIHLPIGGWELVAGLENLGRGFGGESWGMSNPQLALDWLNAAGKFKMENGDRSLRMIKMFFEVLFCVHGKVWAVQSVSRVARKWNCGEPGCV